MERFTFATSPSVEGRTLSGVAHSFGELTLRGGRYIAFASDAFSTRESDVYAFVGHDPNRILGHEAAGTVRLDITAEGMRYEIDLPDTQDGRDTAILVDRGDLTSMSFGVVPGAYKTSKHTDGKSIWTYTSADLFDISPVSMPAFGGTSVQIHGNVADETVASQTIKARQRQRSNQ